MEAAKGRAEIMKVLIADDSSSSRLMVSEIVKEHDLAPEVITAANGKIALEKVRLHEPQLIILDIEMPEMNGIEVLRELKRTRPEIGVIVFSSQGETSADFAVQALELGAFDFVRKPVAHEDFQKAVRDVRDNLHQAMTAFQRSSSIRTILRGQADQRSDTPAVAPAHARSDAPAAPTARENADAPASRNKRRSSPPREIVAIGISTGGPEALSRLIPEFAPDMPFPVLIVQHMPAQFTRALAERLNAKARVTVKEARDMEEAKRGTVYIAPGGRHMAVIRIDNRKFISVTSDPPHNNCRPSVDLLFRSIARVYGERAVAVIMTGMGDDGCEGLKRIKEHGGYIIAQDESTCLVNGMPGAAVALGLPDCIVPLSDIMREINRVTGCR